MPTRNTRSHVEADRPLAKRIGARIRRERLRRGLTQAALAQPRYTKAYVSALENGLIKPSMAALNFLAGRLGVSATSLLADDERSWARLEADLRLASGDWAAALSGYRALLEEAPDELSRAELQAGIAEALYRLDRGREAIAPATEALDRFRAAGRTIDATAASYWLAGAHYLSENASEAEAILRELEAALRAGAPEPTPDFGARVFVALAAVTGRDGRSEAALAYLEGARARIEGLDDRRRGTFLHALAYNYRDLGDVEGALATGQQALALFRAVESRADAGMVDNDLALVYLSLGDVAKARAHVDDALSELAAVEDRRQLAHATETDAQIRLAEGDPDGARGAALRALELADETDNRKAAISARLSLARAARALDDVEVAERRLAEAATLAADAGRTAQLRDVLAEWSDVAAARGDLSRALELSRRALEATKTPPRGEPIPAAPTRRRRSAAATTD